MDSSKSTSQRLCARKIGRAKVYKLNTKNEIVKRLVDLDRELTESYADKMKVAVKV